MRNQSLAISQKQQQVLLTQLATQAMAIKAISFGSYKNHYHDLARKASFSNSFISQCLSHSFSLDAAELRYTACNPKWGQVIRVVNIANTLKRLFGKGEAKSFLSAIQNKTEYRSCRFLLNGYSACIELSPEICAGSSERVYDGVKPVFNGYLCLNYEKGNEKYYFLLINDESFVFYKKNEMLVPWQ